MKKLITYVKTALVLLAMASTQPLAAQCAASFNYTVNPNGTVSFSSTSAGTSSTSTQYFWTFGNGGTYTTIGSPIANSTYTSAGQYVVQLFFITVPSCSAATSQTITIPAINPTCNIAANYSVSYGTNGTVNFINTSVGTGTAPLYMWNFGNGQSATTMNATQTYTANGTYFVTLHAFNQSFGNCHDSITQSIVVSNITSTCVANAGFSLSPTGTPHFWNAFPTAAASVTSAVWSWGDGSTSNTLYTSHTYSAAGMYNICLSVTVSCGATASTCTSYSVYKMSNAANIVQVNVVNPLTVGLEKNDVQALNFGLFPNPNNGSFEIEFTNLNQENVKLTVANLLGKVVYAEEIQHNSSSHKIDNANLAAGVYLIHMEVAGRVYSKKMVVQK